MLVLGAFAKALMLVRSVDGRASPAGLFVGMFAAPGLGWPEGVQEEDRDRLWSWDVPSLEPEAPIGTAAAAEPGAAPGVPVAELIDVEVGTVSVHPVRGL
jgi:hypothetical protein